MTGIEGFNYAKMLRSKPNLHDKDLDRGVARTIELG
jgi:hypothetical protein